MRAPEGEGRSSILVGDLYLLDPERKASAVEYPRWLLLLLIVIGIAAFAVTGFLGYPTDSAPLYTLLHPAWPLFLWLSATVLIIQASIFRHKEAARWKWETLAVTWVCMLIVAAAYIRPDILIQALRNLAIVLGIQGEQGRVLWNITNFGIIALYVIDRSILWIRHKRAKRGNIFVELDAFGARQLQPGDFAPTSLELLAQDLFAGAALCLFLFVIFQVTVINILTQWAAGTHADSCTVAWIIGACQPGNPQNPPTLWFIDLSLALFAIAASALILGAVLFSNAFFRREAAGEVARGVRDIILAAFNPLDVLIRNLRNVLWPSLILLGTVGIATSARYVRLYLHTMSDVQTCGQSARCPDLREFALYLSNSLDTHLFQARASELELLFLALALLGAVGGILAIMASARVVLLEWRIHGRLFSNWLRFLANIAHKVLLVFWIFALGLSALMAALHYVNLTDRAPFPQPGKSTAISSAYFLASVAVLVYRHRPKGRRRAPATAPQE